MAGPYSRAGTAPRRTLGGAADRRALRVVAPRYGFHSLKRRSVSQGFFSSAGAASKDVMHCGPGGQQKLPRLT